MDPLADWVNLANQDNLEQSECLVKLVALVLLEPLDSVDLLVLRV